MINKYTYISFFTLLILFFWKFFSGYQLLLVKTDSMSPKIPKNALIVTEKFRDAKIGEIITYKSPSLSFITHRVVSIEQLGWEKFYFTKGDANEYPDSVPLSSRDIIGKVVCVLPFAGYLFELLFAPVIMLFFFYVPVGYSFGCLVKKFVNVVRT